MASRDADGQKIETFVLEVASQRRCDGRSVPVHFKMNLFGDNECTWDVRLVLEAFYDGTTTAWLTHKVLKNQMNDVAEVLDNAGSSFWAQFAPSRNAFVTNPKLRVLADGPRSRCVYVYHFGAAQLACRVEFYEAYTPRQGPRCSDPCGFVFADSFIPLLLLGLVLRRGEGRHGALPASTYSR